jgi:starch-binding outer membrane protein, SusD/RagB family
VTNPGPVEDAQLNTPEAMTGVVTGMSGDLSAGLDDLIFDNSIMADELAHGGSYTPEGLFWRGIIRPEDVNGLWTGMQTARWTAENGIERMKTVLKESFESFSLTPRAYVLAGVANRMLGENLCSTAIDGGPEQPNTVHFTRAETAFSEAIRIAAAQNNAQFLNAARVGRASVLAAQGKWDQAVADAQLVPTNFVYNAFFAANSTREQNLVYQETNVRNELTVFSTPWANVFRDPRVPWDTIYQGASRAIQKGQDGKTNMFRQKKYVSHDTEVPIAKGTEARMIEAEAALRRGDIAAAFTQINLARAIFTNTSGARVLPDLPAAATLADAWRTLQTERGAHLWLESRRLWDLRRWNAETGPARNTFLDGRDKCIPISRTERLSNPNLVGS